jgi:hypothetical protein
MEIQKSLTTSMLCMLLLGVTQSSADAGIAQIDTFLDVETQAIIDIVAFEKSQSSSNEYMLEQMLGASTGLISDHNSEIHTLSSNKDQFASSINNTSFSSSSSGIDFSSALNSTVSRGSGFLSYANNGSFIDMMLAFDTVTTLEIQLRIDYHRSEPGVDLYAEFELRDLDIPHPAFIEVENPQENGFVELSFITTVAAGESFWIIGGGGVSLTTFGNGESLDSGDLILSASVQVIPAPGGILYLATAGLLCARRRR